MFPSPTDFDFTVYQGQEWRVPMQFYQDEDQTIPMDLTGWEVDMHVRARPSADQSDLIVALSTREDVEGSGRIYFLPDATTEGDIDPDTENPADPTLGRIALLLTSEELSAIEWTGKAKAIPAIVTYYYDLELTDAEGRTRRVLRGKWIFDAEITRQSEETA